MTDFDCSHVAERLDLYLDGELTAPERLAVERHLARCAGCSALATGRAALRNRLRLAVRRTSASPGLAHRVASHRARPRYLPVLLAAAAVLLAVVFARLRSLPDPMNVGLDQHIHCAVPRRYQDRPDVELPPAFAALLPAVDRNAGHGLHIAMAHKCELNGRTYVHIILRNRTTLASLLLTARRPGEDFGNALIHSEPGRAYAVSGFQVGDSLVYLVSNLSTSANRDALGAMSPQLRNALRNVAI